jgi:hypothetical protein
MELTHSISGHPGPRLPTLADELATVQQMLATLDTLTTAGQRHLMTKVVAFVEDHVPLVVERADGGKHSALHEDLALLRHESERPLPSAAAFEERAERLLARLAPQD